MSIEPKPPIIQNKSLPSPSSLPSRIGKAILIAIAAIFALGMLFSYVFAGPWLLTVGLFAFFLAPLFPLGKVDPRPTGRLSEPTPKSYIN